MKFAIRAGSVITPEREIPDCTVLVEDGTIAAVGPEVALPPGTREIRALDRICVPGFIDLHIHGGAGHDLMEADADGFAAIGRHLAAHGTTAYFPTTLTASVARTLDALARLAGFIREFQKAPPAGLQAEPIGIHMEGPFISKIRKGVHPVEYIVAPARDLFDRFQEAAGGTLRLMTMAPEAEGAAEVIRQAFAQGVRVGMGHTDATYEQAEAAVDLGIRHAIHLFNAMRPFSHRDPGVIGAALTDDRLSAELIADGIHVHEPVIRLLARAKGPERILLVTDAVAATGMGDGTYTLGGFEIKVKGPLACNRQGVIAGSVLTLDHALRNMMRFTGLPLRDVVRMATLNQARLMGLEKKGRIAVGADADLVLLTKDLEVAEVCLRGRFTTDNHG
jgi:N-acetylglucosamine-6-phosphate deacetylase